MNHSFNDAIMSQLCALDHVKYGVREGKMLIKRNCL